MMIKQNKGKDLKNIAKSKIPNGPFYCSKKYDGWYTQIKYTPGEGVEMWTSGRKKYLLTDLAKYIMENFTEPFHIECEFTFNCEGLLGDRGNSAKLTTYMTDYKKKLTRFGVSGKDTFRILDRLDSSDTFEKRLDSIFNQFYKKEGDWFQIPHQYKMYTLDECKDLAQRWVKKGFEGAMVKTANHRYVAGKRDNNIIKLKPRLTADLICIGWNYGEVYGKYENCIGSLVLQDRMGRTVKVGSGLSDDERQVDGSYYVNKVIEIQYERIDDTYIQPIYKCIREDKNDFD